MQGGTNALTEPTLIGGYARGGRMIASPHGLPESEPRARLLQTSRGGGHEEEADTVKGDPADARQAGAVPGCRRGGKQRPIQPGEVPQLRTPELQVTFPKIS